MSVKRESEFIERIIEVNTLLIERLERKIDTLIKKLVIKKDYEFLEVNWPSDAKEFFEAKNRGQRRAENIKQVFGENADNEQPLNGENQNDERAQS